MPGVDDGKACAQRRMWLERDPRVRRLISGPIRGDDAPFRLVPNGAYNALVKLATL